MLLIKKCNHKKVRDILCGHINSHISTSVLIRCGYLLYLMDERHFNFGTSQLRVILMSYLISTQGRALLESNSPPRRWTILLRSMLLLTLPSLIGAGDTDSNHKQILWWAPPKLSGGISIVFVLQSPITDQGVGKWYDANGNRRDQTHLWLENETLVCFWRMLTCVHTFAPSH